MGLYRVRAGRQLPVNRGQGPELLSEGTEIELPDHVARDHAVRHHIEPVEPDPTWEPASADQAPTKRYRVKAGQVLPVSGRTLEPGEEIELPDHVATDRAVAHRIEAVEEPVTEPVIDEENP